GADDNTRCRLLYEAAIGDPRRGDLSSGRGPAMKLSRLLSVGLVTIAAMAISSAMSAKAVALPDADLDDRLADAPAQISAVLAGGCFWGIEEVYQHVRGVMNAVSGYSGGPA